MEKGIIKLNSNLRYLVGDNLEGNPEIVDFLDNTNMLISGGSGTGKTWVVKDLIVSLAQNNNPGDVSFKIYGGKGEYSGLTKLNNELGVYDDIPEEDYLEHIESLQQEVRRRKEILDEYGFNRWGELKQHMGNIDEMKHKFPWLFIVVDEYEYLENKLEGINSEVRQEYTRIMDDIIKISGCLGIRMIFVIQRTDNKSFTRKLEDECSVKLGFGLNEFKGEKNKKIYELIKTRGIAIYNQKYLVEPIAVKVANRLDNTDIRIENILKRDK